MSPRRPAAADTPLPAGGPDVASALGQSVLSAVGHLGASALTRSPQASADAHARTRAACVKAGLTAGALALPMGPLGWLTVLPEMVGVWRIQARLVADIAALHGKPPPSPEELLVCLFQHSNARLLHELLVQTGERSLVRAVPAPVLALVAKRLGARLARRVAGKGLARWLPVAGAVGLGAVAVWDTRQVGRTADALYGRAALPRTAPAD